MEKEKILRNIANEIVSNINSTTEPGLFYGRMGLAIFLYEYSKYIGEELYQDIANDLIDSIYKDSGEIKSKSVEEGLAGIGIGLAYLVENGFTGGNTNKIFRNLDNVLLNGLQGNIIGNFKDEEYFFHSLVYYINRIKIDNFDKNGYVLQNFLNNIDWLFEKFLDLVFNIIQPEIIDSIYKSFMYLEKIEVLEKDISRSYLIKIKKYYLKVLEQGKFCRNDFKFMPEGKGLPSVNAFNLWTDFVFNTKSVAFPNSQYYQIINEYINSRISNHSFYINEINNNLAIVGLNLMKNERN